MAKTEDGPVSSSEPQPEESMSKKIKVHLEIVGMFFNEDIEVATDKDGICSVQAVLDAARERFRFC